jgi:hypothetical protein
MLRLFFKYTHSRLLFLFCVRLTIDSGSGYRLLEPALTFVCFEIVGCDEASKRKRLKARNIAIVTKLQKKNVDFSAHFWCSRRLL